jgi:methoxymalonate biosynthesis acyl carrier protein
MQQVDILESLRRFLLRGTHLSRINDDEPIFSMGRVNSIFAVQLVLFVEQHFGLEVADEDLDMANFGSLNALCAFVQRKQAALAEPVGEHG